MNRFTLPIPHSEFQSLLRDFLLRYGIRRHSSHWGLIDVDTILRLSNSGRINIRVHLCFDSTEKYPFIAIEQGLTNEMPTNPPSHDDPQGDVNQNLYLPDVILPGQFNPNKGINPDVEFTITDEEILDHNNNMYSIEDWFSVLTQPDRLLQFTTHILAKPADVRTWKQNFRAEFQTASNEVTYTNLDWLDITKIINQGNIRSFWYTFGYESTPSRIWPGSNKIRVIFGGVTADGVVLASSKDIKAEHTYP